MSQAREVMTLRKLVELVGPEFMDAELSIIVSDGHRNTSWVPMPTNPWDMPRTAANAQTGAPASLNFKARLCGHRLVAEAA